MRFFLPQGIGDSVWAMHKIQSVAEREGAYDIEVFLNCSEPSPIQSRSVDFIRKFDFVKSSQMLVAPIHPNMDPPVDPGGRYIYIDDGWTQCGLEEYYAMMPNGPLERGIRLEDWLPEMKINWKTAEHFTFTEEELKFGKSIREAGEFAMFYLGPLRGNLQDGHNRGALWTPEEWVALGKRLHEERGLRIVAVGADYDYDYFQCFVEPILGDEAPNWTNIIGRTSVGELYATAKQSRFVISYQSGVGIFSSYLGIPTGIFWRPKGDSISCSFFLSFEEEMASAWTRPDMIASGKHLPLIYGRHGVSYIMDSIKERKW